MISGQTESVSLLGVSGFSGAVLDADDKLVVAGARARVCAVNHSCAKIVSSVRMHRICFGCFGVLVVSACCP